MSDNFGLAVAFGPGQPQRFLTAWLGSPLHDIPNSPDPDLPAPLVEWHQQVGRWPSWMMRQNRVPKQREMDGNVLLVGVENQAVWLWGVHGDDANPLVWERENEAGAPWTQTGEHLDEFLWHFTLTEAVLGSAHGLGVCDVSLPAASRFTTGWTALNIKTWRWPGPRQTLWQRDGALAWTTANERPDSPVTNTSTYSIFVGARSHEDLLSIDDCGIRWDTDSRIRAGKDSTPRSSDA